MEQARLPDFYLGVYRVQPSLNRVVRGEEVVRLAPKFMQVLVCLAEQAGEVVTRDELLDRVWTDTVVGEAVLTRAVSALRKAFDDDPQQPRVIETVMKSGYRLLAMPKPAATEGRLAGMLYNGPALSSPVAASRPPRRRWLGAAALVFMGLLLTAWFAARSSEVPAFPLGEYVPLTSYYGEEYDPALSPDGEHIAFIWLRQPLIAPVADEPGSFGDLYVRRIGTEALMRLTTDGAEEHQPVWSPDGRHIAFVRCDPTGAALYVVPSAGGLPQPLTGLGFTDCARPGRISWSPDGEELAFADRASPSQPARLVLLSVATLVREDLTRPPAGAVEDRDPVFSPDGRLVAFTRGRLNGRDVFVAVRGTGEVRRLTKGSFVIEGLDWTPDGRSIIFASRGRLWKVAVDGGVPAPVAVTNTYSSNPTIARRGDRMAFVQAIYDVNLWRLSLDAAPAVPAAPSRFVATTRLDGDPRIAPDGTRVAFISDRDGPCSLWVTDREGRQFTRLATLAPDCMQMAFPQWSPNGRFLAFSAYIDHHRDIFVVPAAGGAVQRLTTDLAEDTAPAWSADGRWIYFGSDRTATWELWRVPLTGGAAERVTEAGGFAAQAAPDGQALYYTKAGQSGLWVRTDGYGEHLLFNELLPDDAANWRAVAGGIYFLDRTGSGNPAVAFFDASTGTIARMATLPSNACVRLDIAPDGRWAVLAQVDHGGRDLALMTNDR